jgi:hypothetical protein
LGAVGLGLGVAIGTLFPRGIGHRASGRSRPANGSPAPLKSARRRRRKARTSSAKARAATAAAS